MDEYGATPLTVVGVIGNVRHSSLTVEPVPEIYAHFFQRPSRARDADLVIRSAKPAALTAAVRAEFEALDPACPSACTRSNRAIGNRWPSRAFRPC